MVEPVIIQVIAEVEFGDIIQSSFFIEHKIRLILINESFIDINISHKSPGKFSFHWETKDKYSSIYRYDNFPDINWKKIETFPYHFHNGKQDIVISSPFPEDIADGFRAFMNFVKEHLNN